MFNNNKKFERIQLPMGVSETWVHPRIAIWWGKMMIIQWFGASSFQTNPLNGYPAHPCRCGSLTSSLQRCRRLWCDHSAFGRGPCALGRLVSLSYQGLTRNFTPRFCAMNKNTINDCVKQCKKVWIMIQKLAIVDTQWIFSCWPSQLAHEFRQALLSSRWFEPIWDAEMLWDGKAVYCGPSWRWQNSIVASWTVKV